jgi:hypothetical protein
MALNEPANDGQRNLFANQPPPAKVRSVQTNASQIAGYIRAFKAVRRASGRAGLQKKSQEFMRFY